MVRQWFTNVWCWLFGHVMGRHTTGPWPGWTRYHCTRCDRWTVCFGDGQHTVDIYGEDAPEKIESKH